MQLDKKGNICIKEKFQRFCFAAGKYREFEISAADLQERQEYEESGPIAAMSM